LRTKVVHKCYGDCELLRRYLFKSAAFLLKCLHCDKTILQQDLTRHATLDPHDT